VPKLIFGTGTFRGVFASCELNYAVSLGVKIKKVHRGVKFAPGGFIFKDYIDTLYKMRLLAKKNKDGVTDILTKLLMNSCYGRMGLRMDRENVKFFDIDNIKDGDEELCSFNLPDGKKMKLMTEKVDLSTSFSNVAVAAWVTAQARIHLHRLLMKAGDEIYYCDTDSLFTTKDFDTGEFLGELKKEYECVEACFLLPKTYSATAEGMVFKMKDEKNKDVKSKTKVVMKGFDKRKLLNFTTDDFYNCLEGELRLLKMCQEPNFKLKKYNAEVEKIHKLISVKQDKHMATFKSAARRGGLLRVLPASPRTIRSMYDKRIMYKSGSDILTRPLELK
jgi:hypothetical protein